MLKSVCTVTYRVADLSRSQQALETCFNYQTVVEHPLQSSISSAWQTAANSGAATAILKPASEQLFYIRLIQAATVADYEPLKTYGWNSAELLVDDVHSLAAELQHSPFRIIGGPRDLMDNGKAIALQVLGPNDELFFLTEINGDAMQNAYGVAQCRVDRLFLAVLGAIDHDRTLAFYRSLGARTTRPRRFAIRVLSAAHGLDAEATEYRIAAACLADKYRIEVDDYPATATRRTTPADEIPPGLSIVSFTVESLQQLNASVAVFDGPPEAPYFGCRFALLKGPNDEWIELLEQ